MRFVKSRMRKSRTSGILRGIHSVTDVSTRPPRGFRIQAYENDIQILKLCVKYGVEIMLGSDAHREEDVGDFTRTEKILKEVDFPEELIVNRSLSYVKNRLRV